MVIKRISTGSRARLVSALSRACLAAAIALLIAATPAVGQAEQDADSVPYRGPGPRVAPIREVDPSDPYRPSEKPIPAPPAPLMEEGRRLLERTGRLARLDDGSYFVFDDSELMLRLLPNHFMQRIEDVSDFGARAMHFRITTTVHQYRGRNYLLMTRAPEVVRSGGPAESAGRSEDDGEAGGAFSGGGSSGFGGDLPSHGVIEDAPAAFPQPGDTPAATEPNDEQRDVPPPPSNLSMPDMPPLQRDVVRPTSPAANHPDGAGEGRDSRTAIGANPMRRSATSEAVLIQDGRWIVDREGRIDRVGDETRFIFDSGDEPMGLLPNAKLERIEVLSDYGRRGQRFRISGSVTAYRGRNFLVLSKVQIIPKAIEDL